MTLTRTEWTHPRIAPVTEVLCPEHDREMHAALRTLGIGSGSCDASDLAEVCLHVVTDTTTEESA